MMMISGGVDCDGDGVDDDGDVEDEMEVDVNDGCDTVRVMGLKRCSLWATRSTTIAIVTAIGNGDNFGKDGDHDDDDQEHFDLQWWLF